MTISEEIKSKALIFLPEILSVLAKFSAKSIKVKVGHKNLIRPGDWHIHVQAIKFLARKVCLACDVTS